VEPYDISATADPFAASRAAFEQLTAELAAPATAGLAHHELEELLDDRGGSCCGSCCKTTWTCEPPGKSGP
jgi:hypothetical protein